VTQTVPDPAARLREAGLRVTGPRVQVLRALDTREHVSAVRSETGIVSTRAVQEALVALDAAGLVQHREPAAVHRLVCRGCGRTEEVGSAPAAPPHSEASGFLIDGAEVTFRGLCPACA
jgi:Fur family transcriptional regulator, stress-responsive regulator